MAGRAEFLFERLQSREAIVSLIGQAEDADFDCKEWPARTDRATGSIAKAACGFANATGGVIVIGMTASSRGANMPDVVTALRPVSDMGAVASAALDIILNQVEPGIEGVRMGSVSDLPGSKEGYVLIYIPETQGSPHRSRLTSEFYVRVASGTLPMEYFQIEDRFGRRPHARLVVEMSPPEIRQQTMPTSMERISWVSVRNEGRGLARFPAIRFSKGLKIQPFYGVFGSDPPAWPLQNVDAKYFSYRGGANDVLYPGELLTVAILVQVGIRPPNTSVNEWGQAKSYIWSFPAEEVVLEAMCEGMAIQGKRFVWPEALYAPN